MKDGCAEVYLDRVRGSSKLAGGGKKMQPRVLVADRADRVGSGGERCPGVGEMKREGRVERLGLPKESDDEGVLALGKRTVGCKVG